MRTRKTSVDYVQYLGVRLAALVLGVIPVATSLRMMRWLGSAWYALPDLLPEVHVPRWLARRPSMHWLVRLSYSNNRLLLRFREHRNRAEGHIRASFPEFRDVQVAAIARESMQQLAMLAVEVLLTPRLLTPWSYRRYVQLLGLDETIRALLDRKGCILLTGHYGNWELLGYTLAVLGFDTVAVMRPLDNRFLNRFLLDRREQSGLKLLYKKGASRSAGDILESGGALCFIADQNAGRKGLFVDFFGRKASTYKSIGLLAMEYDVPIVVNYARRQGTGFRYKIGAQRIIHPEEWRDRNDPLRWITQEFSHAIERFIRESPGQYLWIHRRWKSRPKDEAREETSLVSPA